MKKIILSALALLTTLSISAQTIEVYKYNADGTLSSTPAYTTTDKVKVVFKAASTDPQPGDAVEGTTTINGTTYTKAVGGTVADYVDLGITVDGKKVLWATHNLGASKPEEYGAYIAWGDKGVSEEGYSDGIKLKSGSSYYYWDNNAYNGTSSWTGYNKYTIADGETSGSWYTDGTFSGDNKTTLESQDDAATVNWGSDWRTPTDAELTALRTNCTWTWYASGNTDYNGVAGYKVAGTNGNSIFLPAAGWRYLSSLYSAVFLGVYWSSSLYAGYSIIAYELYFDSSHVGRYDYGYRYSGQSLRPVRASQN